MKWHHRGFAMLASLIAMLGGMLVFTGGIAASRSVNVLRSPPTPHAPSATGQVSPDQTTTTILVSWPAISRCHDGHPCKRYVVTELKNGKRVRSRSTKGSCGRSMLACSTSFGPITNDGSGYAYELQAVNQEGDISARSAPSNVVHADGSPGQITDLTATAKNSSASVSFMLPPSHGASISEVKYQAVSSSQTISGSWSNPGQSGQSVNEAIPGLTPLVSYSVTVAAANEVGEFGPSSNAATVTPYGNPQPPSVSATANGNSITYSWAPGPSDGLSYSISYCIDGSCQSATGPGSTSDSYACGSTHTITATETDSAGQTSGQVSASATTAACPPPQSISIAWGSNAAPAGNWMDITFTNFPTGTVSWTCVEEGVGHGPYHTTLTSSTETLTTNTCYDTQPGGTDYVTSDGYTSNTIGTD
jgi:large repetitive protein